MASELRQNDTVIKYCEKAIEVFPTQPIFYYYAGSAFHYKKSYSQAIEQFTIGKKMTINNNELVVQSVHIESSQNSNLSKRSRMAL